MEFIEATAFTKYVYTYLSEDEYVGLQSFLLQYPEAGQVVPGSGGVRKLRWRMAGKGKRGGVRIIYYFKRQNADRTYADRCHFTAEHAEIAGFYDFSASSAASAVKKRRHCVSPG